MRKKAVILLLETFTRKEIRQFEDFLNSPFYNKNKVVIRLFSLIKKYHPHYPEDKISGEYLFGKFHTGKKYNESYIRNLYSDLNILAEKFLGNIHKADDYPDEKLLINELAGRNLTEVLYKKINSLEKKINHNKSRDQIFFTSRIFINNVRSMSESDRTLADRHIPEIISDNIKLLLITVMESYFQLAVEEQRIRIKHDFGFLNYIFGYVRINIKSFRDSPLLLVYYYLWESFFDKSGEEHFAKARSIFRKRFADFSQTDRKNVYAVMQTFCLKKSEEGNDNFRKAMPEIMVEMLKNKVISHRKDIINLNLYRNILITFFRENNNEGLRKFISDYSGSVDRESRESIKIYSEAHLYFLEGNYKSSLELCSKVQFSSLLLSANENLYFKNDIKSLLLKCLYELELFETALYHIDSYKHFLSNSELIRDNLRRKYTEFIKNVHTMIKLKHNPDEYSLHKLKKAVLNSKNTISGNWILGNLDKI